MSTDKSAHSLFQTFAEHSGDHGSLWKAFNRILHRCPKIHPPDHSSMVALVNSFSSIFINKISVIQSFVPYDSHSRVLKPPDTREVSQNRNCVTADEVRCLVLRVPHKSSDLDTIPTRLVKHHINSPITPITSIVNLSLIESSFPSHFKSALVSLLLKSTSLNKDCMKYYRPLFNLSFLFQGAWESCGEPTKFLHKQFKHIQSVSS